MLDCCELMKPGARNFIALSDEILRAFPIILLQAYSFPAWAACRLLARTQRRFAGLYIVRLTFDHPNAKY